MGAGYDSAGVEQRGIFVQAEEKKTASPRSFVYRMLPTAGPPPFSFTIEVFQFKPPEEWSLYKGGILKTFRFSSGVTTISFAPHNKKIPAPSAPPADPRKTESLDPPIASEEMLRHRAIKWIRSEFGSVNDLQKEVVQVVWVTVYRATEASAYYSRELVLTPGQDSRLHDMVQLLQRGEEDVQKLKFLKKMVPIIRNNQSEMEKIADSQLLIDFLKWKMLDALNMSRWQRFCARFTAKPDPMYQHPVPSEIMK